MEQLCIKKCPNKLKGYKNTTAKYLFKVLIGNINLVVFELNTFNVYHKNTRKASNGVIRTFL